jgi:hypothetical protein
MGHNLNPYTHSPRRSSSRASPSTASGHELWLFQPVSPAGSVGTQDSRYEKA